MRRAIRERISDEREPRAASIRAALSSAHRRGRSPPPEPLVAAPNRDRAVDPHPPALGQYAAGAADPDGGPHRRRAEPSRVSRRHGVHQAISGYRPGRAMVDSGFPVVAGTPAFRQHVLHAVHNRPRHINTGRSPEALLEARLHAGNRMVPLPASGAEVASVTLQGRCSQHGSSSTRPGEPKNEQKTEADKKLGDLTGLF